MNICLLSDTHLRFSPPENRKDDFFATQVGKFKQVVDIYRKHNCQAMLQAGDFFDSYRQPHQLLTTYINLIRDNDLNIFCIMGQHDLYMRSFEHRDKTALGVLEAAGLVHILSKELIVIGGFQVYGASYGEDIPETTNPNSILVIHESIGDKPLWAGDVKLIPPEILLRETSYALILAGDYHFAFEVRSGDRVCLNTGCLVRLSTGKYDLEHHPRVAIYNTATRTVAWEMLDVKPVEEVFHLEDKKQTAVGSNPHVLALIERLKEKASVSLGFLDRLRGAIDAGSELPANVKGWLEKAISEVGK